VEDVQAVRIAPHVKIVSTASIVAEVRNVAFVNKYCNVYTKINSINKPF
jgi:hypothetical protein